MKWNPVEWLAVMANGTRHIKVTARVGSVIYLRNEKTDETYRIETYPSPNDR